MTRRTLLVAVAVGLSCRGGGERCAHCGMRIDPGSAWRADLVMVDGATKHFDSPRCALTAWLTGRDHVSAMRVRDYYDRRWQDASDVLFVAGSDILGPMGHDLVPVDHARAQKFANDHGAGRPLPLGAITADVILQLP